MRQQVRGHERPVRMPANGDVLAVGHPSPHHFIHRCFGVGHQLGQVGVVGFLVAFADDRHRRTHQHRIALGQERLRTPVTDGVETVGRIGHLAGRRSGLELTRVGPHQHRQRAILPGVVARRQHQRRGQVDTVVALVADLFLAHPAQLRQRMLETGQRAWRGGGIGQRLYEVVGRRIGRLAGEQHRGAFLVEQCLRQRIGRRLRMEQTGGGATLEVEAVHKRSVAFRRSTLADQEDAAPIGGDLQARTPVHIAHQRRLAGIVVAVLG